jgi:predicted kinase
MAESTPTHPPQPRTTGVGAALLVMVGLPGTGKSFLARRIAVEIGAELIQTDAVRREMFPHPRYAPREMAAVYQTCHRRIAAALAQNHRVVFDATNLHERGRAVLYRLADQHGASLFVVVAYAPEPVIYSRLRSRIAGRDPADLSDADVTVYRRMRARAEPVRRPHVVANTTVSPASILRLLRLQLANQSEPRARARGSDLASSCKP